MPIYEYRCSDCGHRLEALQRLADSPLLVCPSCGKESLVKLISAVGFQLKGSGWYATDFKNSGAKPADKPKASAESGSDASSGAKGEGGEGGKGAAASSDKSDTKPAAQAAGGESKTASADTKAPAADSGKPADKPAAKPAATGS